MATVKLYHEDAGLDRFGARVLTCRPAGDAWEVILDRTAFYPAAGGQPHDTGTLNGRTVLAVGLDEETDVIVHRVDGPLADTVIGQVDRHRRLDHSEQHTGQHLLSRAFVAVLGAETVSFHLGKDSSTIDLDVPGLAAEQVTQVETRANDVVRENRPVRIHWAADAEAAQRLYPIRRAPEVAGRVRVVEIDGFDWSACGGTHVASTGCLGPVKVKGWERYKNGVRVYFLAGRRALADYQFLDGMVRDLARELSLAPGDLPGQIQRYRDDAARLRKQLKDAREQLLGVEAGTLVADARSIGGTRIVRHVFAGRPFDEVKMLAAQVATRPRSVALFGTRGALPQLAFARSPDLRLDMGAVLRQVLPAIEGKGGGSPSAAQGAGKNAAGVNTALDLALALVAEQVGGTRH